jgi:rRNA-processing protein FCF1
MISHLYADDTLDKVLDTNKLWSDFIGNKYELFISPVVMDELEKCAEPKRGLLYHKLEQIQFQTLNKTDEIETLAREYIKGGVLKEKNLDDCFHIAFAVVYDCDIIVSWNFKHLVNFKTMSKVKIVNAIHQYREISIVSPTMLLEEEDEA